MLPRFRKLEEHAYQLRRIKQTIPSAIIAGGIIRDLYHGKNFKDVDIYVPGSGHSESYSKKFWISQFDLSTDKHTLYGNDSINEFTGTESDYSERNYIDMVWEIRKVSTLYNIIVVDLDPVEYVERFFDVGLCKAYCDGKKIRLTSDFMYDSQYKQLTIVAEDMPKEEFFFMMNKHVAKLKLKYPGHSLVIPERFEEFYNEFDKHTIGHKT